MLPICRSVRGHHGLSTTMLAVLVAVSLVAMHVTCALVADPSSRQSIMVQDDQATASPPFELPPLPYATNALEPVIDNQTMVFHHDVHHANYVKNLNEAIADRSDVKFHNLSHLLMKVGTDDIPDDVETQIRNNGGGHWNHAFFWKIMAPPGTPATSPDAISGDLRAAIEKDFGSLEEMNASLSDKAIKHFGSGWAWLCLTDDGKLKTTHTMNQDNPLMNVVYEDPCIPILGIDVWEHGFYLHYGPAKATYVNMWWQVVNWEQVSRNYDAAWKREYETISTNA